MAQDNKLFFSLAAARQGVRLSTGQLFSVSLSEKASVFVIEVEDVLFRHDSAVLLPEAYDIDPKESADESQERISGLDVLRTTYIRAKEFPDQLMLIAGHTDTTGQDQYNVKLSEKRAKSVVAMLLGQREDWAAISDKQHKNEDIQQILTFIAKRFPALNCDPDGIDGIIGEKTHTATKNFQTGFEAQFGRKIKADGVVGKETWGAFFDVYQSELAKMLDTDVDKLQGFRDSLKFADDGRKAVGCGEFFPIEAPDRDKFRSRINRRVELLFFDPSEKPVLACHAKQESCDPKLCDVNDKRLFSRQHLPVHPHPHAQSQPTFFTPDKPGSTNFVKMHSVFAYVAYFKGEAVDAPDSGVFTFKDGKLTNFDTGEPASIDCDREAFFYFSHRNGFMKGGKFGLFTKDKSKLPLLGPIRVPCGQNAEIRLDMWSQNDWAIINGKEVDGKRADIYLMADFNENYQVGFFGLDKKGVNRFFIFGDNRLKEKQEKFIRDFDPFELINFAPGAPDPLWIGTVSALPTAKCKLIMGVKRDGQPAPSHVGSFNEIVPTGQNQVFDSHHTFDRNLVNRLLALPRDDQPAASIDALPDPPARFLLPGDICWHDQGQTNFCGAFSFAAAMNYWRPFTNNPNAKNGTFYDGQVSKLLIPSGARTPSQIVDAAGKFNMSARDNDAEDLANRGDRKRALKLLKLWLMAGVPVLILVEEEFNLFSLHWKVVVGWDGNRMFIINSGADNESSLDQQEAGVVFDKAPVGNDVDSEAAFFKKWFSTGGDLVDAFSSVDTCTFIPMFPKDANFAGDKAR